MSIRVNALCTLSVLAATCATLAPAHAVTVTLSAARDATIFNDATGNNANGASTHFYVGRTNQGKLRRALLGFDTSIIPAGATITSATLTLYMEQGYLSQNALTVHRVTKQWTEGLSTANGGQPGARVENDVTWIHSSYRSVGAQSWSTPGGDFISAPSATTIVPEPNFYSWTSPTMAADVQGWINNPSNNFGWLIKANESLNRSARSFSSRETPAAAIAPRLVIEYVIPAPGTVAIAGVIGVWSSRRRRSN